MTRKSVWYIYLCEISNSLTKTMDKFENPQDIICGCCKRKGLILLVEGSEE